MLYFQWRKVVLLFLFVVTFVHSAQIKFKVSGRELVPREEKKEDKPDVFVKVRYKKVEEMVTKFKDNNQYPQWSETFDLSYDENSNQPFEFELREEDGGADDEMGKVSVYPKQLLEGVERVVWDKNGNYAGKIRFHSA